jgi:cytochrome c biogenesis factor
MTFYILAALVIAAFGVTYVKGYDLVKAKFPGYLPTFYLVMTTIRMLTVLTIIGIYVLFAEEREDSIRFALTCLYMYVVMMVVTLKLRH